MRFEDLPGPMQDAFESLKHGSATIESDIQDALESADSLEDFCSRAETALNILIEEAVGMRIAFSRCKACKLLSNDSSIVRIADQSTKNIPVKWANVPKGASS
jgi:hypothetical protein